MIYAIVIVAIVAAVAFYFIKRSGSSAAEETPANPALAQSWQIGPIFGGKNYSANLPESPAPAADGIFAFDWQPQASSAHYVTYVNGSLAGKKQIRMKFRLDLDPGAKLYGTGCPETSSSGVTIYLQRRGDNLSGLGLYETFRWWATFVTQLLSTEGGEFEIVAPLDGRWTAVMSSNSIDSAAAFQEALANCERVGFTFANCVGYGHGGSATGNAKFTLLEWVIE